MGRAIRIRIPAWRVQVQITFTFGVKYGCKLEFLEVYGKTAI